MRMLNSNEISVVSGGLEGVDVIASRIGGRRGSSQQWRQLSGMSLDRLLNQQEANAAVTIALAIGLGLITNYIYERLGGAGGIDESIEEFEKWCDEKAREIAETGEMAYEDAKCLLKTLGSSGPGGGAPMTCSFSGASGSW